MTHEEIVERLNLAIAQRHQSGMVRKLRELRDELDPPRPDPGTVVWFRGTYFGASKDWQIGEASHEGIYPIADSDTFDWSMVEYKPARILTPDEVVISKEFAQAIAERLTAWGFKEWAGVIHGAIEDAEAGR